MVLGHSRCGAIKGACDKVELGHLTGLLRNIQPAVESVVEPSDSALRTSANEEFAEAVATENVRRVVRKGIPQPRSNKGLPEPVGSVCEARLKVEPPTKIFQLRVDRAKSSLAGQHEPKALAALRPRLYFDRKHDDQRNSEKESGKAADHIAYASSRASHDERRFGR